ncbi:amidohydrolase family protein [Streptacidiphilus sp. 4-A2]|nr:amidohydrolase family protein [Streptacidiphilus sp. 4-A2]
MAEAPASSSAVTGQADTIYYYGGDIVTVAATREAREAEAVAVRGDTIVFVGGREEAFANWDAAGTAVRRDLEGRALLPGFIDAHAHIGGIGLQATIADLLAEPDGDVGTIAALQRKLREWYDSFSADEGKPGWIVGFGYDDTLLTDEHGITRHPTRDDLDQVSTTRPVLAIHQSFHLGAVNSKGLEVLGYSKETKDPQGGAIRRRNASDSPDFEQPFGEPNGVLEETAFNPAADLAVTSLPPHVSAELLAKGQQAAAAFGYTTVQDGGQALATIDAMRELPFLLDVVAYAKAAEVTGLEGDPVRAGEKYSAGRMRVAGVKLYLDGSPQGRTAWLRDPYLLAPEGKPQPYHGISTIAEADLLAQVRRGFAMEWQIIAHVNGDAAIGQFIRAIRTVAEERGESREELAGRRIVAVHSQTVRADQLDDFQRLAIIPSFFPMHTFYWGDWYGTILGDERARSISPARWALDRGLAYTAHHDAPVAKPSSIGILASQVTRVTRSGEILGPEQCVSALDAVRSITINAARQYGEQASKGSIERGKLADLVILSANPLTVPSEGIKDITVVETVKGGTTVHPEPARGRRRGGTLPAGVRIQTHC